MAGENAGQLALEALAECEEILTEAITPGILRGDMVFVAQANARRVLARPKRNCDVGTTAEQTRRFRAYCGGQCLGKCKVYEKGIALGIVTGTDYYKTDCRLIWAQLPYEAKEGGNGEQKRKT